MTPSKSKFWHFRSDRWIFWNLESVWLDLLTNFDAKSCQKKRYEMGFKFLWVFLKFSFFLCKHQAVKYFIITYVCMEYFGCSNLKLFVFRSSTISQKNFCQDGCTYKLFCNFSSEIWNVLMMKSSCAKCQCTLQIRRLNHYHYYEPWDRSKKGIKKSPVFFSILIRKRNLLKIRATSSLLFLCFLF